MLNALQKLDPSKAQLILSELTKKFLPTPFEAVEEKRDELHSSVLTEILRSLHLEQRQLSSEDKNQILARLLTEMNNLAFNQERQDSARMRLGSKGELSPAQYEIQFGDSLKEYKARDISQGEIVKTLKNPDSYSHLLRGREAKEDEAPISLYVKKFRHRKEDLYLLVETKREGYKQLVSAAWKIFLSDIGGFEGNDPLELLKKFVDVFGSEVRVGNLPPRKFFLYESISLNHKDSSGKTFAFGPVAPLYPDESSHVIQSFMRISPLGILEISILYGINLTKYYESLRAHGVNVKQ